MHTNFLTVLVLFISPFVILAQPTDPVCLSYSRIANLSTIGANSTYRSAFLQSAPDGTFKSASILNNAMALLPALTINAALNQQCGNLTTVAFTEAERNFTEGIVAQFSGIKDPQAFFAGWQMLPMIGIILLIFCGIWSNA